MYKIIRYYRNRGDTLRFITPKGVLPPSNNIIERNLTLEEAQEHCKSKETSSSTCSLPENIEHTEKHGPWFDGYEEQ